MYAIGRISLLIIVGLLLASRPALFAQDGGGDTEKLLRRNWSLFLENYKSGDFASAKPFGWKVHGLDPARFKTLHKKMITIYDTLAVRSDDPVQRAAYGDTIIFFLDDRMVNFPEKKVASQLLKGYYYETIFSDKQEEAIAAYEASVNGDYASADLYNLDRLARLYIELHTEKPDYKLKAVAVLQAILLKDPNNSAAQSMMKNLISDPEEYLDILRTAYFADSDNSRKLYELANGYYEMLQNYDSAAVYFDKLTLLDGSVKNYWEKLGNCWLYVGDYKKASAAYLKLTELDAESKEAWINLARSTYQQGKLSDARKYAEKAQALDKGWGAPHMLVAQCYEEAVRKCVENVRGGWENMKFMDKAVYKLAQTEYQRAAADPTYTDQARARANALKTLVPSKEDLFVNKKLGADMMIRKGCYGWIMRNVMFKK